MMYKRFVIFMLIQKVVVGLVYTPRLEPTEGSGSENPSVSVGV